MAVLRASIDAIVAEPIPQTRRGSLSPGTRVGRYELLRRLARGGMAELYLARASGLHGFEKLCVLKLVLPHLVDDKRFVEMFLHEARTAATLEHPNIAQVIDIGELEGEPFFVMQYVRGRDLRKIAKALGGAPLPLDVALTVASQVAAGLHYVHERQGPEGKPLGLVHRDISPANVMIGFDGDVKIVDFGIAKSAEQSDATRTGVIKGKVSYMAPEQCRGDTIDRRTDVFALGILLCEATTGRRLFRGETDFAIMSQIVDGRFTPPRVLRPDYPEELEAIILRALQREPADRYPTAAAMQADLEAFAQAHGLRLSTLTLSSFMRELYGEQPNAPGVDPLEESPTELKPERPEPSARPTAIEPVEEAPQVDPTGTATVPLAEDELATPLRVERTVAGSRPLAEPVVFGETVIAQAPAEPRGETVISMAAPPIEDELDRPPARATGRLFAAAGVFAIAIGIAVFAMRSHDEADASPQQVAPSTPSAPVKAAAPTPAVEPPPPPTEPQPVHTEPEAEPPSTEPAPSEPPSDAKPSRRSERKRTAPKPARGKPKGKRGAGLDDMYPSG